VGEECEEREQPHAERLFVERKGGDSCLARDEDEGFDVALGGHDDEV
jgi:hypothetical protein